jgi:hypothetical protein
LDWRLYADRSRFSEAAKERFFVIQGAIRRREGKVFGADWHVFLETCDFDAAWASGTLSWAFPAFTPDEQVQLCTTGDLTWEVNFRRIIQRSKVDAPVGYVVRAA